LRSRTRYFDYVEPLASDPDRSMQNLLMIELFEGVVCAEGLASASRRS
jgi:hypothetical protein